MSMRIIAFGLLAQFLAPALVIALAYAAGRATTRGLAIPEFRLFQAGAPATRWKRFGVRSASVAGAFAACLLLAFVAAKVRGTLHPTMAVTVLEGPARRAGVEDGDRIVALDGKRCDTFETLKAELRAGSGSRTLTLERNGERITKVVTPDSQNLIHVEQQTERRPASVAEAAEVALATAFMPLRHLNPRTKSELMGPVGVVKAVSRTRDNEPALWLAIGALYAAYSWMAIAALHVFDALLLRLRGPS